MRSRLAAIVFNDANMVNYVGCSRALRRGLATTAGIPQDEDAEGAAKAYTAQKPPPKNPTNEIDPIMPPKPPQLSPKIESTAVSPPNPITQQKRRFSSNPPPPLDDVNCAAMDGTPWPTEKQGRDDDAEYFKHHKPSPLSNIEVADTRKPITRATDSTAGSPVVGYYGGGDAAVITWRPEQLDSAEEALARAMEIWRQNKARGDPDLPHSRVLRSLRGEI
ncbi:hypothetical protein Nepgr_004427 [Nepenthes gracilis]|uniref:Uncharacterized protein n=1 Tax=Nepenthes gracilis TaxID=150966 RepID=A0AAD3S1B7_NEPGR|nr:hypothetical protein Nepgr_004427 [Nepenthes gracilis]